MTPILDDPTPTRIFLVGCAAIVASQLTSTMALIGSLRRIAGNVVPPDAAEAYAAGYAVGAVRGEQRRAERRQTRRNRGADRARYRRLDEAGGGDR